MQNRNAQENNSFEKMVESLELISARLFDITVANNQIATSQTPEIRRLFDKWLECLTGEILRIVEENSNINIAEFANNLGLSTSSTLSLLLSLERKGKINITNITATIGNGKNKEICDCLQS